MRRVGPLFLASFLMHPLQISPEKIFTYQDVAVHFSATVDCENSSCPQQVELKMLDRDNSNVRARWALSDDGKLGDLKAGDKVYSRTIQFEENKMGTITFFVEEEPWARLQIVARPTFLQILQSIWAKVKS